MKRVIIQCDVCRKECGPTYYTIYKNEGEHVTDKVELCKDCYRVMERAVDGYKEVK